MSTSINRLQMMKKVLILLLIVCALPSAKSQVGFGYRIGHGSYKMSAMSSLLVQIQRDLQQEFPVPMMVTDDFPNHYNHFAEVSYSKRNSDLGVNFTYLSTGGRVAYSDYSGELAYNLHAVGYRFGLHYRNFYFQTNPDQDKNLSLFIELSPGITQNDISSQGYYRTETGRNELAEKYMINSKSTGLSINTYNGIQWNIIRSFGINLGVGYQAELSGKVKDSDTKIDWSGVRVGLGLNYKFVP